MILAILQARVSSTRFYGKVLQPILGKPMLLHQVERIMRCKLIDALVVATSLNEEDHQIAALCRSHQISCYRGSLADVLDRFYQASLGYKAQHIVRLTGDCPLADPELIDNIIQYHAAHNNDYSSNTLQPTFPDGLDVEIFRSHCLEEAWKNAKLLSQREHVTPYIHQQPGRFKLGSFKSHLDLSHLRWTVDEKEDFELISTIYEALYPQNPNFITQDVLAYLDKFPELKKINIHYERNEGMKKSLLHDKEINLL